MILFRNILFSKEFLACNSSFGLFTKIKKGPGTSFWCTFSASFFHKNILCLIRSILSIDKIQCRTFFSSQDIKQNVSSSSYLGNC